MTISKTAHVALRPVIRTKDTDGRAIVLVPLANGERAKLFAKDYDRLQSTGISPNWFLNKDGTGRGYVRVKISSALGWGNLAQVARLIARPSRPGVQVKYLDENRLNLRSDNLYVGTAKGCGKARERFIAVPEVTTAA